MKRDPRYKDFKKLFEKKKIKTIGGIFRYIPKTVICGDLGINYSRFSKATNDPTLFTIKDLERMAELFNVDVMILISMAYSKKNVNRKNKLHG